MLLVWHFCILLLCCLPVLTAQPDAQVFSASSLDSLLQDYGFRALVRPKTGIVYDGAVPSNLTGMRISALRLRSGSLRRKGFEGYKEFDLPIGAVEQPYVERIVLVYQDLGNWSNAYYPLPGYTYLTSVVGILAYDASNLSARNLQELDLVASQDPILVRFANVLQGPKGVSPKCIYFGLDGSVEFNNVINQSVCSGTKQGHFAIGAEFSVSPSPAPSPSPAGGASGNEGGGGGGSGHKNRRRVGIIVGSVVGGALLLVLLCVLFACLAKYRRKRRLHRMEEAAERGEPLVMANVGYTKAPVAVQTRTKPNLEDDYMP